MKQIGKKCISFVFIMLFFFCCQYVGVKYIPIVQFFEQRMEDAFYAKPEGITQNIKIRDILTLRSLCNLSIRRQLRKFLILHHTY